MSSDKVREFHEKFGFPVNESCPEKLSERQYFALGQVERHVFAATQEASTWRCNIDNHSLSIDRIYLILEELHELVRACQVEDKKEIADAIADLAYVVTGTAVAFGLPLDELVAEVHRSNMTKTPGQFKPYKGEDYSPPDIEAVLWRYKK